MKRASMVEICAMLAAALTPSIAMGEIYKCVQDGKTIYQDQPCRGAGSALVVAPRDPRDIAPTAADSEEQLTRLRASVNEMARERRKREIAFEVSGIEREIAGYERAEKIELAALAEKRDYNYNDRNAARWQKETLLQSIDAEIRSVTEKYATMKQAARDRVLRLQKEVADVAKSR